MNLTNVNYTPKELNQIIILNVLRMLEKRNLITDIYNKYDQIKDNILSNKTIKVNLDNGNESLVYIINGKVTSVTQNSPIDEFLSSNTNLLKIVIIKEPSKKAFKQITFDYPNSELFFQREFLEDIPEKDIVPKHTLLNSEEKEELLQYIKLKNFKKIFTTDMMSRYFDAKVGDVFRIERLNITSGKAVDYRVVVQGKIDILF